MGQRNSLDAVSKRRIPFIAPAANRTLVTNVPELPWPPLAYIAAFIQFN
jgi:hypothetical protein